MTLTAAIETPELLAALTEEGLTADPITGLVEITINEVHDDDGTPRWEVEDSTGLTDPTTVDRSAGEARAIADEMADDFEGHFGVRPPVRTI